jgi:hypothetical protein
MRANRPLTVTVGNVTEAHTLRATRPLPLFVIVHDFGALQILEPEWNWASKDVAREIETADGTVMLINLSRASEPWQAVIMKAVRTVNPSTKTPLKRLRQALLKTNPTLENRQWN